MNYLDLDLTSLIVAVIAVFVAGVISRAVVTESAAEMALGGCTGETPVPSGISDPKPRDAAGPLVSGGVPSEIRDSTGWPVIKGERESSRATDPP